MDASQDRAAELEAQAQQAQQKYESCRQQRRDAEHAVRDAQKRVKELSIKIPKLQLELGGFDTTREQLSKLIPELRIQSKLTAEDQKKLDVLNEQVEKRKADMKDCVEQASGLEKAIEALQAKILNAGGPRLKKQQKMCEKVLAALDDAEKKLASAKVTVKTSEKTMLKARNAKERAETDLVRYKEEFAEKEELVKKLEEEAFVVMQEYEQVKANEAEKREAMEEVLKESESIKRSQAAMKGAEIDLLGRVEASEKLLDEHRKRVGHWEREIAKLVSAAEEDDEILDGDDDDEDEDEDDIAKEHADKDTSMENDDRTDQDIDGETKESDAMDVDASTDGASNKESGKKRPKKQKEKGSSLPVLSLQALSNYLGGDLERDIDTLEAERANLARNANMGAITEYRKKETDYLSR